MKKKGILFALAGFLVVGGVTGMTYANTNNDTIETNNVKITSTLNSEANITKVESREINELDLEQKEMVRLMKEYGFEDMAKAFEDRDYKAMDEFMNNITDEDYQKMIDIMRKSGYESMANMMGSVDRESMIKMHNSMGGSESCHEDSNNNMMGSF
ncbi:hypothetical protein [Asaccharospora irregularis]|uniref:Uncharacterized protein n=1 Tax=Asaccharospora irregularis DSM 2635 TaxID=1121321 RepID=A0A1M5T9X0_9FIRM|nr:hypothetical protein [Asaccharospora irregularis]SHH47514.1 hypothetical protein SAMN04488530_15415 [Asaccharospora irregularis DSM 2635]